MTFRRCAALGCCLALGAVPTVAEAASTRAVTAAYRGFAATDGVVVLNSPQHVAPDPLGRVSIATRPTERSVTLQLQDTTGRAVAAVVAEASPDGTLVGGETEIARFCASTRSLRLPHPGRTLVVTLLAGSGCEGSSLPVDGTIVATFR